ncbi:hypothetical protein EYF80_052150 [Liparis tanakae]|uniref:Uncharacterized protein n=1 Tax=Liparis tanakae TaxID=230148 RepID=A0A4Z2F9U9_9TELE|nr:hypothetical protein EYF80_052150 [Liparis tanakae]
MRPGTRSARGEAAVCCCDSGRVELVTRRDEELALLGWCHTLVLLFASGFKDVTLVIMLQRGSKAEVDEEWYTAHTVTSRDESEIAYLLDKCHQIAPPSPEGGALYPKVESVRPLERHFREEERRRGGEEARRRGGEEEGAKGLTGNGASDLWERQTVRKMGFSTSCDKAALPMVITEHQQRAF